MTPKEKATFTNSQLKIIWSALAELKAVNDSKYDEYGYDKDLDNKVDRIKSRIRKQLE